MKMRSTRALVFTIALAVFAATVGYGQAKSADPQSSKAVVAEIGNQPGCPLLLAVLSIENAVPFGSKADANVAGADVADKTRTTIRLKVDNIGDKPIRGYSIGFLGENSKMISTTALARFLERAQSNPIPATASAEWAKVLLSVDYVEFSDGTSWGNDSFKRSEQIERFKAGRDLAYSRFKEIVVNYPDHEFFLKQVDSFRGISTSDHFPVPSAQMLRNQFEFGYDSVLKGLRTPNRRQAEGQEIARRLELMQQTQPPTQ